MSAAEEHSDASLGLVLSALLQRLQALWSGVGIHAPVLSPSRNVYRWGLLALEVTYTLQLSCLVSSLS